jgi:hypothetical protein
LDFFHMLNGFLYLFFKSIWIWNFYFNIKESPSEYRRGRDEFEDRVYRRSRWETPNLIASEGLVFLSN